MNKTRRYFRAGVKRTSLNLLENDRVAENKSFRRADEKFSFYSKLFLFFLLLVMHSKITPGAAGEIAWR